MNKNLLMMVGKKGIDLRKYTPYPDNLVAYLPLTKSVTEDKCGNEIVVEGDTYPIITERNGDLCCYLTKQNIILTKLNKELGGNLPFTVDFWVDPISFDTDGQLIGMYSSLRWNNRCFLAKKSNTAFNLDANTGNTNNNQSPTAITVSSVYDHMHIALIYNGSTKVTLYVNGVSKGSSNKSIPRVEKHIALGYSNNTNTLSSTAYFHHLRVHDGVALWNANFTPPTYNDKDELIV